MNKIKSHTNR